MKILLGNKYFFIKGGAENAFFATAELIKKKGHQDIPFSMKDKRNFSSSFDKYFVSNVDYKRNDLGHRISNVLNIFYSLEAKRNIDKLICDTIPDLVHLHNIYHQISPSILHVTKKHQLPVVMTLHDYKIICGSYSMFANEQPCEACCGERYYQCFCKGCVKDSRMKSMITTVEMYLHHKLLHIYDLVDIFISPSRFLKEKVEAMGFKSKIVYLSNFIHVEAFVPCFEFQGRTICYIGRLSKEKYSLVFGSSFSWDFSFTSWGGSGFHTIQRVRKLDGQEKSLLWVYSFSHSTYHLALPIPNRLI